MNSERGQPPDVVLQPTSREDLPRLLKLWNDGRVMRLVGFPNGLGWDAARVEAWFDALQISPRRRHFSIYIPDGTFCGETHYRVDAEHNLGSLDIKLHIQAQGQGIATAAFRELIQCVFEENPDVQAVWVEPWPENLRAHRLYSRCGFAPHPRPGHLGEGPSYWELHRQSWMPSP